MATAANVFKQICYGNRDGLSAGIICAGELSQMGGTLMECSVPRPSGTSVVDGVWCMGIRGSGRRRGGFCCGDILFRRCDILFRRCVCMLTYRLCTITGWDEVKGGQVRVYTFILPEGWSGARCMHYGIVRVLIWMTVVYMSWHAVARGSAS